MLNRVIGELHRKIVQKGEQDFADAHQKKDEDWGVDGPQPKKYDVAFKFFLKARESFENLLRIRKAEGKTCHVLDLFGSGYLFEDPSVADSITGLRLLDPEEKFASKPGMVEAVKAYREHPNRKVIENSIFSKEAFLALQSRVQELGHKFDIITCKAVGAWSKIFPTLPDGSDIPTDDVETYGMIFSVYLNRVWQLLAEDGELFLQLPFKFSNSQVIAFFDRIDKKIEYELDLQRGIFYAKKPKGSPKMLLTKP